MKQNSTATTAERRVLRRGLAWGALGVAAFSLSLPTTQIAVAQLGPAFATSGRAVAAAALAAAYLVWWRAPRPPRHLLLPLVVVAVGVVAGFPLLTALAMQREDAAHGAVIVGLLPAATAALGVVRTGERPSPAFWAACTAGAGAVTLFALVRGQGLPTSGDAFTVAAVIAAAIGYVEGARLAPLLGADKVICWALVIALPVALPVLIWSSATRPPMADVAGWTCFAYTAIFSMFLGFFAWYHGLALGGVAKVSQVQLAQPLLTVAASALIFGQHVDAAIIVAALAVLVCVAAAQRTRVHHAPPPPRPATPHQARDRDSLPDRSTGTPGAA